MMVALYISVVIPQHFNCKLHQLESESIELGTHVLSYTINSV